MADNRTSIILTAEDRASATLGKVGGALDKLGGSAAGLGALKTALGGLAGAFSAGALISFAKGAIDAADNLNDLSERVGISIRDLGAWQYAAQLSGTSLETVAKGVKGLSTYMVQYGDRLKDMGISTTNANVAITQLANIFANLPDGMEKTALAVQLFGKAGMDMIPMLNLGSRGLAEMQAKSAAYAEKLAELAPKAGRFNDALDDLGFSAKSAAINGLLPLMDGLVGVAQFLGDVAAGGDRAEKALKWLSEGSAIGKGLARYIEFAQTANALAGIGQEPLKRESSGRIGVKSSSAAPGVPAPPGANSEAEKAAMAAANKLLVRPEGAKGAKAGKSELQRMIEQGQKNQLDDYYATGGEETMRIEAEKRAVESARAETREREKANAAAESALRKYRDMIDPLQKYRVQLEEVANLEGLSDAERLEATWRINEAMDAEIDKLKGVGDEAQKTNDFARDMGLSFSSAFEDAIIQGKSFSDVLKAIEQDIARIALRKLVTEPAGDLVAKGVDWASKKAGDIIGGLFGGGRAAGGPVSAGQFYVVGENGPEILVPGMAGTVIPNGASPGGAAPITVNLSYQIDSRTDMATIAMMMARTKQDTLAAIGNAQRRGG
ncbi:MAG: hypothetical protein KJ787_13900 [Gammaproteobacteria bacterium]|nr:hypothetical protein [Gammaproteobacteria bacterium]MBU1647420.1 hypothetical protein [Gammaproteobacteria bacterium]MBU1973212.1 hypothetical protein [Gammaproteobacteria bacterium]